MTDEAFARHIEVYHTYDQEQIEQMVTEHRVLVDDLVTDFEMMMDDLYGKKAPTPADPYRRKGGRFTNGGVKLKLSLYLNALITGIFVLLAAIAGALITSLI